MSLAQSPAKPSWAGNYVYYIVPDEVLGAIKLDIRIANYSGQETLCKEQANKEFDSLRAALPKQLVLKMCLNGRCLREE